MTAPSHKNVETHHVLLYQPDEVLQQRISSIEELGEYIKQIQAVVEESFKDSKTAEALDVVIIIAPGGRARAWLISSLPTPPDRSELTGRLQAITPPPVKDGPLAFAVAINIAGARRTNPGPQGFSPPIPKEWHKASENASRPLVVPDDLVDQLWKN